VNFPIQTVEELEELSQEVTWQWFEKLVAFIFSENEFKVEQNVVKTFEKDKRQYDVIATRFNTTFIVECKKVKKMSRGMLKKIVKKHLERTERIRGQPLVVTLNGSSDFIEGVPIVPIRDLNAFINTMFV